MFPCQKRSKMLGESLQALAHSELRKPSEDTLSALGEVALEIADELQAIEDAYVEESNKAYKAGVRVDARAASNHQRADVERYTEGMRRVWTLRKGLRVASCHLWTHPLGGEVKLTVDGDWVRGESRRHGAELVELAVEWRTQFESKGRGV